MIVLQVVTKSESNDIASRYIKY